MILKILLSSVLVLALSGCSFLPSVKKIETVKTAVERPALNLPNPQPLSLKKVEWVVVTRENAEAVFADLEKQGKAIALFAMTTDGYEALALNIADIKGYLATQKEIIIQYREYYEPKKEEENDNEK
jgi:hypothetical protein